MHSFIIKISTCMFFLNIIITFAFAVSLNRLTPSSEEIKNFIDNKRQAGKCEIVELEWPHVKKRSLDSKILFPVSIFGKQINLNLVPTKNLLVGSNTPVYYLDTQYDFLRLKVKTHIFREDQWELYEDEKELTSIYVKINPDGSKQIQFGYIGSELFTFELTPNVFSYSNTSYYLARSHKTNETIVPELTKNFQSIPNVVYPELLLIIDYQEYVEYNKNHQLFPYLLTFWNIVNMIFRSIQDPKIEISIAGVMIAQDEKVIHYMSGNHYGYERKSFMNYEEIASNISGYLYSKQNIIPQDTYDMFVISTTKKDEDDSIYVIYGKALVGGACSINDTTKQINRLIIIRERNHVTDINVAAHEVAHSLGVNHNEEIDVDCVSYDTVMSANLHGIKKKWSKCSIDTLHQVSRNTSFSCLFNKPNFTNSVFDNEFSEDDTNLNGKWLEFYMTVDKNVRELISPREIYTKKNIEVSFENNKTVVKLIEKLFFTKNDSTQRHNLHRMVPDDKKLIIDLATINPLKDISIFHDHNMIHAHQSEDAKPAERWRNQVLPPLHVFAGSDKVLTIKACDLDRNKLIAIFYKDNRLVVTQDFKVEDEKDFSGYDVINLNKNNVVSDDIKIYIRPFQLNPHQMIRIYHKNTSIYVSQIDDENI